MKGYLSLLSNRNFVLLWGGQAISQLGDSIFYVAFIWMVVELTGSALAIGSLLIAIQIPALMCQVISGVVVDRYDRQRIALGADLLRGLMVAGLALVLLAGRLELWQLYMLAIAFGIVGAFFGPAMRALLPDLVQPEQLPAANGLRTATRELMEILGPALGGLLLAATGAWTISALNALSFFIGALGLGLIHSSASITKERAPKGRQALWRDFVGGFSYLRAHQAITALLALAAVLNCVSAPIGTLLPLFVRQSLQAGPDSYGLLLSSAAGGMVVGSLFVGLVRLERKGLFLIGLVILTGLLFSGLTSARDLSVALGMMGLIGALNAMANVMVEALLQSVVADEYRGRIFALATLIAGSLQPLAWGLVGVLADWFGVVTIMLASGLLTSVVGMVGLFNKDLRCL